MDIPNATLTRVAQPSPYARWLDYFEDRHGRELQAPYVARFVERPGRAALARSIERFELGESGDGERLRRLATPDRGRHLRAGH